jgi:hypothetical protein
MAAAECHLSGSLIFIPLLLHPCDRLGYTSGNPTKATDMGGGEMEETKKSRDGMDGGRPSARSVEAGGSSGNGTNAHPPSAAAAASQTLDGSVDQSSSQLDPNDASKSFDTGCSRFAHAQEPSTNETDTAAFTPAEEQQQQQQHQQETRVGQIGSGKKAGKRSKSASAAASQSKQGATEESAIAAPEPAHASKKRVRVPGDTTGDVMVAIIGKENHRGQWRWKVQWQSGAMVSATNLLFGGGRPEFASTGMQSCFHRSAI